MWFLGLGILALALKYFEIGVVATWSWWLVLLPFALAAVWWQFADSSGYTKRKQMEKEQARHDERIERHRSDLGMLKTSSRRKRRSGR
ncbi:MAG: TIGR04438 family Trp-rich protein [Variovorax sp.]